MIDTIVPHGVSSAEAFGDLPDAVLFAKEAELISNAVENRQREFKSGRHLAHEALAELGIPPEPILSGPRGEPTWPSTIVGSITHCVGYRAAAVGERRTFMSLGIDAEPHQRLSQDVFSAIARPSELDHVETLMGILPHTCWDRLLFCAKEATFKTWYPLTRKGLEFEDVRIVIDSVERTFLAELLVSDPFLRSQGISAFSGRWALSTDLIVAACVLGAPK